MPWLFFLFRAELKCKLLIPTGSLAKNSLKAKAEIVERVAGNESMATHSYTKVGNQNGQRQYP